MDQQAFITLEEYFKTLREEIHLRLKEHTRLVWLKLASLGAVMSFLVTKDIGPESPILILAWVIPLGAVIFDTLIAGNLRVVHNIGRYVMDYVEKGAYDKSRAAIQQECPPCVEFRYWEEAGAHRKGVWRCYRTRDMFSIWLFSLASLFFAILVRWAHMPSVEDIVLLVLCVLGTLWGMIEILVPVNKGLAKRWEKIEKLIRRT